MNIVWAFVCAQSIQCEYWTASTFRLSLSRSLSLSLPLTFTTSYSIVLVDIKSITMHNNMLCVFDYMLHHFSATFRPSNDTLYRLASYNCWNLCIPISIIFELIASNNRSNSSNTSSFFLSLILLRLFALHDFSLVVIIFTWNISVSCDFFFALWMKSLLFNAFIILWANI